jgi:hypothetical protein
MKRVFTVMLIATACVVGSTPSFARGGVGHGLGGGGGFVRNPTTPLGASPPPSPTLEKPHSGAARGTCPGTRHQRAGGAESIRRRYVSASAANRSTTGEMLPAG